MGRAVGMKEASSRDYSAVCTGMGGIKWVKIFFDGVAEGGSGGDCGYCDGLS